MEYFMPTIPLDTGLSGERDKCGSPQQCVCVRRGDSVTNTFCHLYSVRPRGQDVVSNFPPDRKHGSLGYIASADFRDRLLQSSVFPIYLQSR
jgi:hypothetical protein